jgi:hypothetical protein
MFGFHLPQREPGGEPFEKPMTVLNRPSPRFRLDIEGRQPTCRMRRTHSSPPAGEGGLDQVPGEFNLTFDRAEVIEPVHSSFGGGRSHVAVQCLYIILSAGMRLFNDPFIDVRKRRSGLINSARYI